MNDIISCVRYLWNKENIVEGLNQTPAAFDAAVFNQPLIIDSLTMENSSKYSIEGLFF